MLDAFLANSAEGPKAGLGAERTHKPGADGNISLVVTLGLALTPNHATSDKSHLDAR